MDEKKYIDVYLTFQYTEGANNHYLMTKEFPTKDNIGEAMSMCFGKKVNPLNTPGTVVKMQVTEDLNSVRVQKRAFATGVWPVLSDVAKWRARQEVHKTLTSEFKALEQVKLCNMVQPLKEIYKSLPYSHRAVFLAQICAEISK